jgi:hypothetical protein
VENGEQTLEPPNIKQLKGKEGQVTPVMLKEYMAGAHEHMKDENRAMKDFARRPIYRSRLRSVISLAVCPGQTSYKFFRLFFTTHLVLDFVTVCMRGGCDVVARFTIFFRVLSSRLHF